MRRLRPVLVLATLLVTTLALAEDESKRGKQKARGDGPSVATLVWAREVVAERLKLGERAPAFAPDRDWLNVSRPLTLEEDLKGKVVVLDFWCYCCINCLHVLPDLEYLEERYKDAPFAVVGVHSAKFENEKDAAQIRQAILRYEIHHPVVNDADFKIWRSYGARAWPTFAVIAPDGTFIGVMSGEGRREELDALVQALLERFEQLEPKALNRTPLPMRLEKTTKPPGMLAYPGKVLADEARGSLFIADSGHNRIVEVALDGTFKRAFGTGERGLVDGPADKARFHRPQGMAIHDDVLWVCDTKNHAIRRIDLETGAVTTAAGTGAKGNHWKLARPGTKGETHGPWPGKTTALSSPWDILFLDGVGHIAMAGSHSMWSIDPKTNEVRHTAGDLTERRLDADEPFKAAFAQPSGLATDGKVLFIADSESSAILQMTPGGAVVTLAGAEKDKPKNLFHFGDEDGVGWGKRFQHPMGVAYADGKVWVADAYNHKVKTLDTKAHRVTSYVGIGDPGFDARLGRERFSEPSGLSRVGTNLFLADTNNHAIRVLPIGAAPEHRTVSTLALRGIPIPRPHAKGGLGTAWPVIPGTVVRPKVTAATGRREGTMLELELELPPGWNLSPDAPSMLRFSYLAGDRIPTWQHLDVPITSLKTTMRVPRMEVFHMDACRVRLLYYVCSEGGACQIRSVDIPLVLTLLPLRDGKEPPPATIVLRDVYLPVGR